MFDEKLEGEQGRTSSTLSDESSSICSLFKNKALRLPLLLIPLIFLTVDMMYFGINLSLQNLRGSIYTNGIISGST